MVSGLVGRAGQLALWAAAPPPETLLERLDPANRAKVLMAILGVVLVGLALVFFIWLGARHVRRIARQPMSKTQPHDERWYQKPLPPAEPGGPDAGDPE